MRLPLFQVDAFASRLFTGNPAAVVVMPEFADDATLRAIAAENNLAETAFLVIADGRYRLRWFTPVLEVPLCGHATLATAAVVMEVLEPGRGEVAFDTASGALTVTRDGDAYRMDFPTRPGRVIDAPAGLAEALGATPREVVDDRFNFIAVFDDADTVRRLQPDMAAIARLPRGGVVVTAAGDAPYDITSRYFAPGKGVPEDPVTGGAHCGLLPYWAPRLGRSTLRCWQASTRGGEMTCTLRGDRVELAGRCVFYLRGEIEL
ncbi:PhzF family phenazine biosynthesis protein [Lysobacter sp. TY2-98]|uniref:PhzF family phenazine biosynthesis protein n=1 Tax=Lysobacter sp. TY2-98 TaxID=2290922 RepID=UPI000E20BFEA|nr:PhzF family phenazine biosynthesis protein [Lysobacter sp. TY2-98]AXK73614.1 PhzF family phenazine biosynthesis protein [Lysobacter sp. TY2-98]